MTTIPSWFVILMGMGTVFLALVCIVILCKILSAVCMLGEKSKEAPAPAVSAPAVAQETVNRQEIICAIGTAIAEECGVSVNAIRIVSIRKI